MCYDTNSLDKLIYMCGKHSWLSTHFPLQNDSALHYVDS